MQFQSILSKCSVEGMLTMMVHWRSPIVCSGICHNTKIRCGINWCEYNQQLHRHMVPTVPTTHARDPHLNKSPSWTNVYAKQHTNEKNTKLFEKWAPLAVTAKSMMTIPMYSYVFLGIPMGSIGIPGNLEHGTTFGNSFLSRKEAHCARTFGE